MTYTVESKQNAVVKSVFQTTERAFASSSAADQPTIGQDTKQENAEVYFQIED